MPNSNEKHQSYIPIPFGIEKNFVRAGECLTVQTSIPKINTIPLSIPTNNSINVQKDNLLASIPAASIEICDPRVRKKEKIEKPQKKNPTQ